VVGGVLRTSPGSIAPDQQNWMRRRVEDLKAAMAPTDQLAWSDSARDNAPLLAPFTDPVCSAISASEPIRGAGTKYRRRAHCAESLVFSPAPTSE